MAEQLCVHWDSPACTTGFPSKDYCYSLTAVDRDGSIWIEFLPHWGREQWVWLWLWSRKLDDVAALWELVHSYKCKFFPLPFSGKDEGAHGGPGWKICFWWSWAISRNLLFPNQAKYVTLTHVRIFIQPFWALKEICSDLCLYSRFILSSHVLSSSFTQKSKILTVYQ